MSAVRAVDRVPAAPGAAAATNVTFWGSIRGCLMALDTDKLNALLGKGVSDFGATFHAACVRIGDQLGLYKGLADGGPQTPAELAKRTGTVERYVSEWLNSQAAGGSPTSTA